MMNALLRWDPFRGDWGGFGQNLEFLPRFDVKETKAAYVINADLPGVKDEELEVSLSGNLLTSAESARRSTARKGRATTRWSGATAPTA
jgi:HSP20 family protein